MSDVPWMVPVPVRTKVQRVAPWVAVPDAAHGRLVASPIVPTTLPLIVIPPAQLPEKSPVI